MADPRQGPLRAVVLALTLLVAAVPATAGDGPAPEPDALWLAPGDGAEQRVRLHFFWTRTCPHCAAARPFVKQLAARHDWLLLHDYDVSRSLAARETSALLARNVEREIEGVPSFFFCGRMLVGFDTADRMGVALEAALLRCRRQLVISGGPAPPAATAAAVDQPATVSLPLFGALDAAVLSLPVLTVVLGGLDAFNPCAFFVLLFLLSLLVHAGGRGRMLLIGGTFVLFSGLVYFAFMAAWLNLFLVLEGVGWITRLAGLVALAIGALNVKDFFAFHQGPSLSIPEAAKPGLYARMRGLLKADNVATLLAGTVALALAANAYELLCTSGLPLVYTRILTLEQLPAAAYYGWLALYNVVYVLPLLAIVLAFTWSLGRRRLSEAEGRGLKLLSGLMMLGLGGVLLLRPEALGNLLTAVILLAAALALTGAALWVVRRRAG